MNIKKYNWAVIILISVLVLVTLSSTLIEVIELSRLPKFNYAQVYTLGGEIIEGELEKYTTISTHLVYIKFSSGEELLADSDNVTMMVVK